jgi:hypothetical protein
MADRGIRIDFDADPARFSAGIQKINAQLTTLESNAYKVGFGIGKAFAFIGTAVASAGMVEFTKTVVDGLNKLDDLSKSTGINASRLAGLGIAAKRSGTDLEKISHLITTFTQNVGRSQKEFENFGVTAKDPLEAFKQIADISNAIKDPMQRNAVLTKAFGDEWRAAAPLLAEGSAGIARLVEEGEKASGVTDKAASEAAKFNSELEEMKSRVGGVAVAIVGDFLPAMNSVLGKLQTASKTNFFGFLSSSSEEEQNAQRTIDELKKKVGSLNKLREELTAPTLANKLNNGLLGRIISGGVTDVEAIDAQIAGAQKKIEYLQGLVKKSEGISGGSNTKTPGATSINDFLGGAKGKTGKTDAEKEYEALIRKQNSFIEGLQKEADTLGMTSVQQKLYEAGLLKITGAQLDGVKTNVERIENFRNEKEALESMRDSYAEATESYLKFIQATASDIKSATSKVDRLKMEISLMDKTESARNKALAQFDLEIKYQERLNELRGKNISKNIFNIQKEALERAKAHEQEALQFQELLDTQKRAAGEAQKIWDNFGFNFQRNVGDQIYNTLNGDFKDIGTAWKSMLTRMLADAAAANLSNAIFGKDGSSGLLGAGLKILGAFLSLGGAAAGGGSTAGALRVTSPGPIMQAAKGAYFDSNVAKFANGGIVNSPTPFKFADGGSFRSGLMGEAGPEAIMPLKRDSQGRLGVAAQGGGAITIHDNRVINIDSRSDRASILQDIQRLNKQSNAELIEKLERQGRV